MVTSGLCTALHWGKRREKCGKKKKSCLKLKWIIKKKKKNLLVHLKEADGSEYLIHSLSISR